MRRRAGEWRGNEEGGKNGGMENGGSNVASDQDMLLALTRYCSAHSVAVIISAFQAEDSGSNPGGRTRARAFRFSLSLTSLLFSLSLSSLLFSLSLSSLLIFSLTAGRQRGAAPRRRTPQTERNGADPVNVPGDGVLRVNDLFAASSWHWQLLLLNRRTRAEAAACEGRPAAGVTVSTRSAFAAGVRRSDCPAPCPQ